MENGVHIRQFGEGIKDSASDVRHSFADQPINENRRYMLAERLETYKNAASHGYITKSFQVAVLFQVTKT